MKERIQFITRTALLLALTLVFQMTRPLFPPNLASFAVGSLVNASLLVSVGMVGLWGGLIISIIAPIVAFFQQQIKFIWMVPIVAVGNAIIVWLFALVRKRKEWLALLIGAVAKFLFLWIAMVQLAIPLSGLKGPAAQVMSLSFSWPQLVTGIIGGIIAISVLRVLERTFRRP